MLSIILQKPQLVIGEERRRRRVKDYIEFRNDIWRSTPKSIRLKSTEVRPPRKKGLAESYSQLSSA